DGHGHGDVAGGRFDGAGVPGGGDPFRCHGVRCVRVEPGDAGGAQIGQVNLGGSGAGGTGGDVDGFGPGGVGAAAVVLQGDQRRCGQCGDCRQQAVRSPIVGALLAGRVVQEVSPPLRPWSIGEREATVSVLAPKNATLPVVQVKVTVTALPG